MVLEVMVVISGLTLGDSRGLQPPVVPCSGQAAARLLGAVFPAGSVLLFVSTRFFFTKAVAFRSGELGVCFPKTVMSQGEQFQCVTK